MTENRAAASRIGYMDGLRAAAMVGVILIHVCAKAATALAADGQALGVSWQLANLLDALGRFAVPAYLMVTGGLLLGSDGRCRCGRRCAGEWCASRRRWFSGRRRIWGYRPRQCPATTGRGRAANLFNKPAEIHLWYLYALLAIYLLLPLLRLLVRQAPRRLLWYAIGLWVAFSSLWRAAAGLIPALQLPDYANLDILGGYLGYVLLGWLLTTTERTPSKGLCTAGFLAGLLVTAGGTWFMTRRAGELNGVFYQYFMPNVVLMAACAFLLFKGLWAGRESGRVIRPLSALSFGVYLVHEVFLRLLEPVFAPLPAAAGMLRSPWRCWRFLLAAAWLLSLIPGVRFITLGERK